MVHIDLCTQEGVMKAYAFQTPMQAMTLLEKLKMMNFSGLIWSGKGAAIPVRIILLKGSAAALILNRSGVNFA